MGIIMLTLPEILVVRTKAKTRIFEVEEVDLKFSNGVITTYERINSTTGAVMVIPFDGKNFIFSEEYCVGTEQYELGFTKGKIDAGEEPIVSAHRELAEEIGIGAKQMIHLRTITFAPGFMKLLMHIYLALDLYDYKLNTGDEPEEIQTKVISFSKAQELLNNPNAPLRESRSLVGLMHAIDYIKMHNVVQN